jgi:dethiobiotin synthetase
MKRYFVTGIGTGVGKTLVSAVLTEALRADYWKPVQTGALEDSDRRAVSSLVSNPDTIFFKEAYHFKEPASPHLAAFYEQSEIDETKIVLPASQNEHLVMEGAGGLLVPLNERCFVIDLARQLDAEVILVCRNYLGCINHSLLSLDYLLRNNFKIKGLVLNGNFDPLVRSAIVNYARVPVLAEWGEIPRINQAQVVQLSKQIALTKAILGK